MLKSLSLRNFRNFESADFELEGSSTVFLGANGRGKTSLLEAIYFLSTLRSFRTSKIREMKRIGSRGFELALKMMRREDWERELRIEDFSERRLFLDGQPVRRASEFAGRFQCVAFLPDDPVIVTGSPVLRRRFLDMFICMLDGDYFRALQKYASALKTRNSLLKSGRADRSLLNVYGVLLAEAGSLIVNRRIQLLKVLEEKTALLLQEIRPELEDFQMISRHSAETLDRERFQEKLEKTIDKELERCATLTGPHVDDFDLLANGKALRFYGSRGQCRMVSLALKLAEFELISEQSAKVVVLVDDAVADLDLKAKESFLLKTRKAGQVFYAFTDLPDDEVFRASRIISL